MSAPTRVDDGNFAVIAQNGSITWENPLSDVGDFDHFIARVKKRVDVSSYTSGVSLTPGTFVSGNGSLIGYLVGLGTPGLVGNNLIEWEALYANVPANRVEPSSTVYTQQWLQQNVVSAELSIFEITNKRATNVLYEYYFKNTPLPVLIAPRLEQLENVIFAFGGWRIFNDGEQVLAEDSEHSRYLGDIFVRKSTYITWVQRVVLQ